MYGALEVKAKGTITKFDKIWQPLWQKEFTPKQTITIYTYSGSSITAGTQEDIDAERVIQNGHFVYTELDVDELSGAGVELDLYCGDKFVIVGSVNVRLEDGELYFKFSETRSMGDFGVMVSDSENLYHPDIKHNNPASVNCPVDEGIFFLYLHIEKGTFVTGIDEGPIVKELTAEYFVRNDFVKNNYHDPEDIDIEIVVTDYAGAVIKELDNLHPGKYTVTYSINGMVVFTKDVDVFGGETAKSCYNAGNTDEFSGTDTDLPIKYLRPNIYHELVVTTVYK
jgi:hypothetical protein